MASDNDIKNRKPNTLESIGASSDYTGSYRRDIELMEQRSNIQTLEMTRLLDKINAATKKHQEIAREAAAVASRQAQPSEALFKSMMSSKKYAEMMADKPSQAQLVAYSTSAFSEYETYYEKVIAQMYGKYGAAKQERRQDAARLLQQHVLSSLKDPSVGMRGIMREPEVQLGASAYLEKATLEQLQKGVGRTTGSISRIGQELLLATQQIGQEGGREAFLSKAQEYEQSRRKLAQLRLAVGMKEERRAEDEYILASSERFGERVGSRRTKESIREGTLKGSYGSISDIRKAISEKEDQFISALGRFREELSQTGEVTKEVREKLNDARSSLEEHNEALKHATRTAKDRFETGISAARQVMGVASFGLLGADQEQMQLRIQAASMMNKRFSDTYAASQGDMAALRRISQDQFGRAAAFGQAYANRALGFGGAGVALDITQGVMSGMTGGVGGLFAAGANAAMGAVRMGKGITRAEAELGFASQYNQLLDVVNEVPDRAKQAYFDFKTAAGRSMVGAGLSVGALYSSATSAETINQLANLGITPDRIGDLFGVGARAIGPSFGKNVSRAGQMVTRAAEMERAGVMSAQQYMQNVAQMTNVGGSEKTMEDILASAVARGVDDAKSLKGIIDLTTMMSREAASRGVAVAPGIEKAVSAGLGLVSGLPIDESLKQGMVGNILQQTLQRQREGGLNLENITAITRLGKYGIRSEAAGKIVTTDAIEARRIYETYRGQLKEGGELPLDVLYGAGEFAEVFVDPRTGKVRSQKEIEDILRITPDIKTFGLAFGPRDKKMMERIRRGEASASEIMKSRGHIGGRAAGAMMLEGALSGALDQRAPVNLSNVALGEYTDVQRIFAAQAGAQAGMITQGAGFFQQQAGMQFNAVTGQMEPADPLRNIAGAMEAARSRVDVEKAGKEAAGAAEGMTIDTTEFDKSVTSFAAAVAKFEEAIRPLGMTSKRPDLQSFYLDEYDPDRESKRMISSRGGPV